MPLKKMSLDQIDNILKSQKLIFAMWNASSKKDAPYQNYYLPLKKLFGKTILFDPRKIRFSRGSEKMNKIFLSLIKKEKPNYIFLNIGRDELTIETMETIKKISPKTKIISFVGDDDRDFESIKRYQALFVDCNFVAQPNYLIKYQKDLIKNIYPTVGINIDIFKPVKKEKIYDVVFIGQPSQPRLNSLRFLIKNKVNLKIFGRGWEEYPEFKKFFGGALKTEDMIKTINSCKINLALSKNKYGVPHFKGRVFEIAACKSFSLVDYFDGYKKFLKEDKEIVMFKNNEDLLDKINYYLKEDKKREEIAKNSFKKIIVNHNIEKEFKFLFKKIMENQEKFSPCSPNLKWKIINLNEEDLIKTDDKIKKLIKDFDCVSFSEKNTIPLEYKNYLQTYSLYKTKKQISCCDYYVYNDKFGNYLMSNIYESFKHFQKNKFNQLISICQLVVKKEYFINNLGYFRDFFDRNHKINMMEKKNTCFISIPLIKMKKMKKIDYDVFSFAFQKIFIIKIYSLFKQKKIFSPKYLFSTIFFLIKNPYLARCFIEFVVNKSNRNKRKI